ncbi:N-acetylglucosamine-6-phosphate deacetylase [Mycobacterium montefiorense]|uniref:N-acetylglucosamine-6-phosphate deacetylase n=2 Tax=Mycobacterium TaxID=1763 RepID=A0AA37UWH8_9MYCO|nr:N-acetylglucosamine-6-phosphate deacetylase [Mycobacterium montefiorense]GBG37124.1 N-acetylglucosamine-6-phosphate deacetylase [Mycobacterium montefiorense]GKU36716.1 N-acetylglucosamine-6-phosphate deacetylase [Mycobacterium montefiorense]GKU42959.1 N-acetylglucosamine-6-phosphate deacetylase [Mycobacterium montefiorense]GKU48410.1 N-acetylglucosamine-6-phosphate deacetylase [Mycobacterium montefiorense]GKU50929.1 N-acetylglucosamine-6-phosphate deacetylase [Mycobacterium montefiorense]
MPLIRADTVVLDGQICRPGWLQISGGQILACGAGAAPGQPDRDFPDCLVVPGFVDMHVHGGGGASYLDAEHIAKAAQFHQGHGTTTTMASLVTAAPDVLIAGVRALAGATREGTIAGIHLEGPWLSVARCGAHDPTQMRDPEPAEINGLLAAGEGAIRMVTLAPERPGSSEAIRRLLDAGVVVALGHTDATYERTHQAIALGATVGTHLFNAMAPLHHRQPGPGLALLEHPDVTVELNADGVHLHPATVQAVARAAGPDRVAVITDAIAAAGSEDGKYQLGAIPIDVQSGIARVHATSTIAGSTATMDQLFRTVSRLGSDDDAALAAAVQMTSTTPARALHLERVGALQVGYDANLVVLDRDLRVSAVMTQGAWR